MKKKVLSLVLATTMIAGLTACGGSEAPQDSQAAPAESNQVEQSEAAQSEEAQGTTEEVRTVDLLVWAPSEDQAEDTGNWLATMCEKFDEEHPEWEINFSYGVCAEGDAKATVTQDVEAAADVYMFANDNLNDLLASGAIARLGGATLDYVNAEIPASLVNSVTVDGAVYGIPFTSNTWFMYYNKSIFTEEDVKNLDNMLAKTKVAFPLTNSWYIASFYAANECTLFEDGTNEAAGIDFGGDKAVAVTNYLVDLVANPNFVNDADGAGISGLTDGTIGAMFTGSWDYQNIVDAIGVENVGAAQLPTITIDGAEKQMKAFAGSKAIGVNPHCEDADVAIALAAYLGGVDAQRAHYEMRGIIPASNTVAADDAVKADVVANAQSATIANTSIMQPIVANMGRYWSPAENMGKAILAKEVTHDNAAEQTELMNESMNKDAVQ
ncbi:MAG: extracellular solute-binding protein [Lachnospiraceae bacterium]|nr:extracellular solute-binding protein [Lachnospiraceae bacterium]